MRIYLNTISDDIKKLRYTRSTDAWLNQTVSSIEEEPTAMPGTLDLSFYRSQELIVLKGQYQGSIGMCCSRCVDKLAIPLSADFQCFFTRDETFADSLGLTSGNRNGANEDADMVYLDKEYIELPEIIHEQLYLKVPFQPLCNADCKGLCAVCGQNQNTEPCQCHRIPRGTMAKALQNLRLDR